MNYAAYCNKEVDNLLQQLLKELDLDKQRALVKQILTLEHADLATQVDDIGIRREHVVAVEEHLAAGAGAGDQVMHPIEDA